MESPERKKWQNAGADGAPKRRQTPLRRARRSEGGGTGCRPVQRLGEVRHRGAGGLKYQTVRAANRRSARWPHMSRSCGNAQGPGWCAEHNRPVNGRGPSSARSSGPVRQRPICRDRYERDRQAATADIEKLPDSTLSPGRMKSASVAGDWALYLRQCVCTPTTQDFTQNTLRRKSVGLACCLECAAYIRSDKVRSRPSFGVRTLRRYAVDATVLRLFQCLDPARLKHRKPDLCASDLHYSLDPMIAV